MESKDKDPKSHISWCLKQKRGIKLEEPNDNICNIYNFINALFVCGRETD